MRVDLAEGGLLAEGSVPMPFSLVGRDDACDVTLTDSEVNPRHAWLQVLGGRVFAIDLGSRTGLSWPGGATGSGWLEVGTPVRIGPFRLRLRSPVAGRFTVAHTCNPLQSDSLAAKACPKVSLEFRNGNRAKDRWTVNRLVTLIGRAPECKIRLTADGIAGYHCGLVLGPNGLWVVDLSGRGVVVNGERMRVSPLLQGAELWIGRFLVGVHYPSTATTPPVGRPGMLTSPNPLPALSLASEPSRPGQITPQPEEAPEDEVELGAAPTVDPTSGLPSSHIMADAFHLWGNANGNNGPVSNPILVSGSGPMPHPSPVQSGHAFVRQAASAGMLAELFSPMPDPTDDVVQLLRQLGEIHGQMLAQFQQTLMLMVQLFGCLRRDQFPAMQRELERIQELNTELTKLQGEVARRAAEMTTASGRTAPRIAPATPTPMPDREIIPARTEPNDSTDLHHWVIERIDSLQKERQTRWQSIVGLFSEKNVG
jgi:pSer/pThr/pTyr-binding forkhead associated (FHA) protein